MDSLGQDFLVLKRLHFFHPAQVTWSAGEPSCEELLQQFPGEGGADRG